MENIKNCEIHLDDNEQSVAIIQITREDVGDLIYTYANAGKFLKNRAKKFIDKGYLTLASRDCIEADKYEKAIIELRSLEYRIKEHEAWKAELDEEIEKEKKKENTWEDIPF